jgi:superfamily I DNA/RNA helicase
LNLQDLNMPQQQAVKCIDRPCLVLAGAGSGKTGVITRKIAWLIHQGYAAYHICAVTFTNKAAREMRRRMTALVDRKAARGLAYVGITRAASSLTLSYAKTRQKFGSMLQCEVSRFLYELPEADLEGAEHTLSKLPECEKHQRGLDTFANLKVLLGTAD